MRALLVLALASCWTGSVPEPTLTNDVKQAGPPRARLHVTLERTSCPDCPAYTIEVREHIASWTGRYNVPRDGETVTTKVSSKQFSELDRAIDAVRFFDRDERGTFPAPPACTTDGTTTTCSIGATISICSESSHTIITVKRGDKSHRVDFDYSCNQDEQQLPLVELADRIDRIAQTRRWVQRE